MDRASLIDDAILYTLNQETYLHRYLADEHLSIDNNSTEHTIINFAVGVGSGCFPRASGE